MYGVISRRRRLTCSKTFPLSFFFFLVLSLQHQQFRLVFRPLLPFSFLPCSPATPHRSRSPVHGRACPCISAEWRCTSTCLPRSFSLGLKWVHKKAGRSRGDEQKQLRNMRTLVWDIVPSSFVHPSSTSFFSSSADSPDTPLERLSLSCLS